jgi:hypothetical protein
VEHRVFQNELGGTQQVQRMDVGARHASFYQMVTLDERTHDEASQFLLSKRKVSVVDWVVSLNFS